VPKQIWKIDEFHGGINDNADPRDILNNELAVAENVAVSELGKLRMLGGVGDAHTAPTDADVSAGYGLFQFSHDMAGADVVGEVAIAPTDYLALSDTLDTTGGDSSTSVIDLAADGGAWSDGGADNVGVTFSNAVSGKADMYFVDGALRVSDAGFDATAAPKWYGYIGDNSSGTAANKVMMTTASTSVSLPKKFYERNSKIAKPSSSTYEPAETQPIHSASYTAAASEINALSLTSATSASDAVVHGNITGASVDEVTRVIVEIEAVMKDDSLSIAGSWDYDIKVEEDDGGNEIEITDNIGQGPLINYHSFEYTSNVTVDQDWSITLTVASIDTDSIERIKVNSVEFIKASGSYSDHTGLSNSSHNFHISLKQHSGSVTDAFGWGEKWEIGMSLIYDGNQESLIRQLVDESATTDKVFDWTSYNDRPPDIAVFCQYGTGWNPRITGAVVYMKRVLDKQWYPQLELDFVRGNGTAIFSDKERPVQFASLDSVNSYIFQFYQEDLLEPQFALTYESRTGISHEEKSISSLWKTSCVANRRAYIGNLKTANEDGTVEFLPDTMIRSLPNKFDIFPISEKVDVAINDGEEIIAIEEFNDRILQFKERTLYIINASQDTEFLEDKLDYRGVTHQASVFKTEYGIVWANVHGCFYYDGRRVNDLLEKDGRPLIKQSTWESFAGTPLVGYTPKTKQVIVVRDCRALFTLTGSINVTGTNTAVPGTGTKFLTELHIGDSIVVSGETRTVSSITNNTTATVSAAWGSDLANDASPDCIPAGDAYIYDMITKSWTKAVGAFPTTNKTNFAIDWAGDLIYSSHDGDATSLLKKWTDTPTQTLPKVITKDIDFGNPSQKKSVKKVYISYKGDGSAVTVLYGKDGIIPASNFYRTGADGSSTNATDSATPLHSSTVGIDDWVCAELKPVAGSITCNSFRIAIDGTAGTDFEINDISIVYRPKSVK